MLIFDDVSPLERIQLSGALASNLRALNEPVSAIQRIKLAGAIAAILAKLGVTPGRIDRLNFSLQDKEGSNKSLLDYMERGLAALSPALRTYEALTVSSLGATIGSTKVEREAEQMAWDGVHTHTDMEAKTLAVFNEISARGVPLTIDSASVLAKIDEAQNLMRQGSGSDPVFVEVNGKLDQMNTDFLAFETNIKLQLDAERQRLADLDPDDRDRSALSALQDKRAEYAENYKKTFAAVRLIAVNRLKEFEAEKAEKAIEMFRAEGEAVIGSIMAASPVTAEQATAWASRQIIDAAALGKLSRLGYKKADVYRDLADFYRLTGGKSSAVRLSVDGGKRANAVGVDARLDEKVINLGSNFDRTTLFHELAHFLENDPISKAASNGFLVKRRESPQPYSLRELTGNKNYGPNEIAVKDSFMNAYIGKIYRDGVTEVFSMGVQYLANPKDAAIFAAKDPEMFALISGYLTSDLTPAMHAKLNMHVGAIDDLQTKREDESAKYTSAIELLSSQVTITPDTWWDDLKANDGYVAGLLESYAFTRGKTPKYIGSYGEYKVFEGVFRNKNTKRNAKGYLVASRIGSGVIPDYCPVHGDINTVKALITLTINGGDSLKQTWYRVFMEYPGRDPKKTLIDTAAAILGSLQ